MIYLVLRYFRHAIHGDGSVFYFCCPTYLPLLNLKHEEHS